MRYPNASTEPVEDIRSNECEASPSLVTSRMQALWNEIENNRDLAEARRLRIIELENALRAVLNHSDADQLGRLKVENEALQCLIKPNP